MALAHRSALGTRASRPHTTALGRFARWLSRALCVRPRDGPLWSSEPCDAGECDFQRSGNHHEGPGDDARFVRPHWMDRRCLPPARARPRSTHQPRSARARAAALSVLLPSLAWLAAWLRGVGPSLQRRKPLCRDGRGRYNRRRRPNCHRLGRAWNGKHHSGILTPPPRRLALLVSPSPSPEALATCMNGSMCAQAADRQAKARKTAICLFLLLIAVAGLIVILIKTTS